MIDLIITVYNTPINDLKRCIDSIKKQTYKNWELFLIDDGSNYKIKNWLDKIKDDKIIVIHKPNGGVSSARNLGLSKAKDDYIMFCDSDDTLNSNCFDEAIRIMNKYNPDIVIGGISFLYPNIKKDYKTNKSHYYNKKEIYNIFDNMLSGKTKKNDTVLNNLLTARVVSKLYKREILQNHLFSTDLSIHEDSLFSLELIPKIKSVYVTESIWYEYYQNNYSATHKSYSATKLNQEIIFADKLNEYKEFFQKKGLINPFRFRLLNISGLYFQILAEKEGNCRKEIKKLIENPCFVELKKIEKKEYTNLKFKEKIFIIVMKIKSNNIKLLLLSLIVKVLHILKKNKK